MKAAGTYIVSHIIYSVPLIQSASIQHSVEPSIMISYMYMYTVMGEVHDMYEVSSISSILILNYFLVR